MKNANASHRAFTLGELLIVLGTIALLTALALPLLANTSSRSERVACVNNLRLIAGAYYRWSADHGDRLPWLVPVPLGGTQGNINTHIQFSVLSNELTSPRFLADPGDHRRNLRQATRWEFTAPDGLMRYGNDALSYGIGLHATPFLPQSLISGDRHTRTSGKTSCFSGLNPATYIQTGAAAWTNAVHGEVGNIAFMDGRVGQVGTPGLRSAIDWNNNWNVHFLFPY